MNCIRIAGAIKRACILTLFIATICRPALAQSEQGDGDSLANRPEVPGVPGESGVPEYRIGVNDLVAVSVYEAPDLSRSVRVSASGEISLPLLGAFPAAGQTPRELEMAIADRLRARYMKDPQVSVSVQDM